MSNNDPQNSTNPSLNLSAGEKLAGAYTLKAALSAESGLSVWLAHDDELDREVALHFLPGAVRADARMMNDLRAAVRRNRQLIHPGIVRVHDLIEEENWAAITMDYVEGETIASLLKKKPNGCFEVREIQPWIGQLCQTVEDAHKIELHHGDLAPVNLIIGKNGELHVANFGVNRIVLDALGRLRQSARGSGDLAYVSPQQLDGEPLGKSDDIYALGVTIYELLTGKPPFHSGDLIAQIRRDVAPKISDRRSEFKISGEPIPREWEQTVAQCLDKANTARPKSMHEVAAQLSVDKMTSAARPVAGEQKPPVADDVAKSAAEAKAVETAKAAPTLAEAQKQAPGAAAVAKPSAVSNLSQVKSATPLAAKVVSKHAVPAKESGSLVSEAGREKIAAGSPEEGAEAGGDPSAKQPKGKHFPRASFLEVPAEAQPKSKVPKVAVVVIALFILIGIVGYLLPKNGGDSQKTAGTTAEPAQPSTVSAEKESNADEPKPEPTPAAVEKTPPPKIANASVNAATPAPTPVPAAAPLDMMAKLAQVEQVAAEKARIADTAKKAASAAGQSHEEKRKLQEAADAAAKDAQKAADDKVLLVAAVKKANDDLLSTRKLREDARDKAEAEAAEAAKVAAEKARVADDAKKAALDVIQQTNEKLAQQEKAETEAQELQKVAAEKQQMAEAAAKAAMDAESIYNQQLAVAKQAEDESAQAQSSVERAKNAEAARKASKEAEQMRLVREQEAKRLEAQAAEAQKAANEAMEMLNKARKLSEEANRLQKQSEEARKKAEAEAQGILPTALPTPAPSTPKPSASIVPDKLTAEPPKLVLKTETKFDPATKTPNSKIPSVSVHVPEAKATVEKSLQNSLGMKFAPVGDVLFSVWLTRVQDYNAFAKSTNLRPGAWHRPDFKQEADHPAVNVSWIDAISFCKWLSEKEQKEGYLNANQFYRLPTDLEWSRAVGLPEESGSTPEARDMGVPDIYPWGTQWPPPPGAGNYTGEETNSDVAIKGYNDGFPYTSPVGSFSANKFGLYDMGGNVWQWCMDWWSKEQKSKTLRGGSWYNGALKLSLLSSCRINSPPDKTSDNYGFRVVITTVDQNAAKR